MARDFGKSGIKMADPLQHQPLKELPPNAKPRKEDIMTAWRMMEYRWCRMQETMEEFNKNMPALIESRKMHAHAMRVQNMWIATLVLSTLITAWRIW